VPQVSRGIRLLYSGHPEQAVPVYRQALEIDGLARAGRRASAEEMLRDFGRRRKAGFYPARVLAKAHVGLGNVEQALDWLELSVDEKLFGHYLPSVDQV
jgi:hypothetical protein